jgi:hypothetical protein
MKIENLDSGLAVWGIIIGILIVVLPPGKGIIWLEILGFFICGFLLFRAIRDWRNARQPKRK